MGKSGKPPILTLVINAIKGNKNKLKGASRKAIYTAIGKLYPGTSIAVVRNTIKKAVADGTLVEGASKSRFKLTDKARELIKPPKKKKKKKTAKKKPSKKKKKKRTVKRKKRTVKQKA